MLLFRTVANNPPLAEDFRSQVAMGRPVVSSDARLERLAEGVSTWTTFEKNVAKAGLKFGAFVAELEVPEDGSVLYEINEKRGHVTIWLAPEDFLPLVVAVRAIES